MSDNLKDAKECGAKIEEPLPTMHWITFCDDELDAYTARRLASQQAAHDAEIAKLREEIARQAAGWRIANREALDCRLQLASANAACAMKDAALINLSKLQRGDHTAPLSSEVFRQVDSAISSSQPQVSEWEHKQLEPLRAQVAMWTAIAKGLSFGTDWNSGTHAKIYRPKLLAALSNTQATAEQFIAECEQRGAVKALEDALAEFDTYDNVRDVERHLSRRISELRATSKKAG